MKKPFLLVLLQVEWGRNWMKARHCFFFQSPFDPEALLALAGLKTPPNLHGTTRVGQKAATFVSHVSCWTELSQAQHSSCCCCCTVQIQEDIYLLRVGRVDSDVWPSPTFEHGHLAFYLILSSGPLQGKAKASVSVLDCTPAQTFSCIRACTPAAATGLLHL